jgi:hypothetical protein
MQGSVLRHSTQTFNYMQVCIILLSLRGLGRSLASLDNDIEWIFGSKSGVPFDPK